MTEYEEVHLTLKKLSVHINALITKRALRPPINPQQPQPQPQTQKPKED